MQAYSISTNVLPKAQSQACQCPGGRGEDVPLPTSRKALIYTSFCFLSMLPLSGLDDTHHSLGG